MKSERVVMLADCQSFYASVEKADHPQHKDRPLIVAGDPERRSGIVLAACPLAKQYGVTTAETLGTALPKCPDLVVMRPRMERYISVSMQITNIMKQFTDLVEPYSIDEQHLDVTGSLSLFGEPEMLALTIQQKIRRETGIYSRFGISYNKAVSKMACDNFAKKNANGLYTLPREAVSKVLWPLPIRQMFMVGSRMERHLLRMGIRTIGELANTPLARLRQRWGVNGEVLWRLANGIDDSPVDPNSHQGEKSIGHEMTLPRDYYSLEETAVPLLELTELVCRRCREKGYMGGVVSVGCRGADFDHPTGFYRQMKLPDPTNVTKQVYDGVMRLFRRHWDGQPVRKVGVTLTGLVRDDEYQLTLFDERPRYQALERATDEIKRRYGESAIFRAVSLTGAGQARDRAGKIGGHYR
ncbi:DNA polymerase IV [Paenibacillus timonensis]|uniref:DNA polymerase IV n=1 Tax=Paenibacillus timonensis TaxID=225915 RepID=A0ABW3S4T5_9BACL|nr:DNA polymerase IV [Paenibacillus timonensis]MCH1641238.1 DNA polymerase IV [Paenibacillus timonensis]